jgi:AcrR family transcriptional regulator
LVPAVKGLNVHSVKSTLSIKHMKKDSIDKRRAILTAALELIAANGFHGAPTAMIAAAAGVGTGTI